MTLNRPLYKKNESCAKKEIKNDPKDWFAWLDIAYASQTLKNIRKAIAIFKYLLATMPPNDDFYPFIKVFYQQITDSNFRVLKTSLHGKFSIIKGLIYMRGLVLVMC